MMHLLPALLAALPATAPQDVLPVAREGRLFQLQGPEGQLLRRSATPLEEARLLEVGDTRVALWQEAGETWTAIQVDDRPFAQARPVDPVLHLRHGAFDPLDGGAPDLADSVLAPGLPAEGIGVHIVQLASPSLSDLRAELRAAGAELLRYLPANAHLAALDAEALEAVRALDFVRWVGPYHPEYRLDPELLAALEQDALPALQHYHLQVQRPGLVDKERVADRITSAGGHVGEYSDQGYFLDAWLSPSQLVLAAGLDEVLYVDLFGEPQTYMDKVRVDGGANFLEAVSLWSGQGVAGEVLDSGVMVNHPDFQTNPPIVHHHNNANDSHGTAVAGIVFGDGTGNSAARGLLPSGQMIASSFIGGVGNGDRYQHTAELLQPPYEAVFQTNSWGFGTTTSYNNWSTQIDDILFQYDIVILQAQANNGNTSSDGFAWGKNVVSVGGIRHQNTQTLADDTWSNAGSTGPAEDGRIKPDLSYWYDSIFTTATGGGYTPSFGGTSAATPMAAGYFGLFFQMWHENVFGTNPGGATVFESRPRATLARAMVINNADQYAFQGGTADLKRVNQGWGRPDVQRMYELRDRIFVVEETEVLEELESVSYQLEVAAGEPELRATLVYMDLPGTTSSNQHRINDVSLKATSPSGIVYWGNFQMKGNMYTQPGGSENNRDTVENVWVQDPEVGVWTIEVIASEINADARPETPGVDDVDFALVVSGVVVDSCTSPVVVCSSTPNSTGQTAGLSTSGSVSVAANDLVFHGSDLPAGQNALLFYGPSNLTSPFGNGILCVGGPYGRLGIVQADGAGNATWNLDVTQPPNSMTQITPGSSWTFQLWFRDPAAGGASFDLSDAVEALFCN